MLDEARPPSADPGSTLRSTLRRLGRRDHRSLNSGSPRLNRQSPARLRPDHPTGAADPGATPRGHTLASTALLVPPPGTRVFWWSAGGDRIPIGAGFSGKLPPCTGSAASSPNG